MESQVRKELKDLCLDILRDDSPKSIVDHLTKVQMLYENLLVLNYLNEARKEKEAEAQKAEEEVSTVASGPTDPVKSGEIQPPAEDDPSPPINESPVNRKELTDDRTPEERLNELEKTFADASPALKKGSLNDQFNRGTIKIG